MAKEVVILFPHRLHYGAVLTANYLLSKGIDVSCIGIKDYGDEKGVPYSDSKELNQVYKEIKKRDPCLVALSNLYLPSDFIKKLNQEHHTILAGYDTTARMSNICKADEPIEMAVFGTGHEIPKLVKDIKEGRITKEKRKEYENILFKDGKQKFNSPKLIYKKECFIPKEICDDVEMISISSEEKGMEKIKCQVAPILDIYGCSHKKCIFCVENATYVSCIVFTNDERKKTTQKLD